MRLLRILMGLILVSVIIGGFYLWRFPYSLFSQWMNGEGWNQFYEVSDYRSLYLNPVSLEKMSESKEEYPELWKDFPIRSTMLPLPVRHPFFVTIPLIEFDKKANRLQLGISFVGPGGRENSRIYVLPSSVQKDYTTKLELFKLPYVKNRLLSKSPEEVWNDTFSRQLVIKDKPLHEMIYDLYILYIRSKLLPKGAIRYGINANKQAIVEIESRDKDYIVEMVMIPNRGNLYTYFVRTEKNNEESRKLRTKFLTNVTFSPLDTDMSRILYTEFKQLRFSQQIDQEGMLYLFSAWSQDTSNVELLKEMIFYLERGSKYHKHLSTFYKYAFLKYGKTFTTRDVFTDQDEPEIALQRKIELEAQEKGSTVSREKVKEPGAELTPDERINIYLKKAKEASPEKKDEMTIH